MRMIVFTASFLILDNAPYLVVFFSSETWYHYQKQLAFEVTNILTQLPLSLLTKNVKRKKFFLPGKLKEPRLEFSTAFNNASFVFFFPFQNLFKKKNSLNVIQSFLIDKFKFYKLYFPHSICALKTINLLCNVGVQSQHWCKMPTGQAIAFKIFLMSYC